MKKLCLFMALLLAVGVAFAASQPAEGKKFEFSTGISFWSYSYHYPGEPAGYSYTESYLNFPLRLGWYFWKGFELEPEFMLTKYHEHEVYPPSYDYKYNATGWLLSGNLLYNLKLNKSHFVPFILAGWGFGNGIPYGEYVERWDPQTKASTPNLGVGVKYMFSNIGALRLEYRYRHLRLNDKYEGEIDHVTLNTIILGLSLFF
jgi:opacity protein-like surface antigen